MLKQSFYYDPLMGSKIREYLLEKQVLNGWKQHEMADKLGVPKGTLSRWLSGGAEPDRESLKKISDGLGVPIQEVIDAWMGTYKPMSQVEREAIEIRRKYSPEALRLACQDLKSVLIEDAVRRGMKEKK